MDIVTILFIAIGLSMDAFAVSIATSIGLKCVSRVQVMRLSFVCGFFQFAMPVIGWYAGSAFSFYISAADHWIAFALLVLIGGKMIREALEVEKDENRDGAFEVVINGEKCLNVADNECVCGRSVCFRKGKTDPTRGWPLLVVGVATSIDALAVGISLAMLGTGIWYPSAIIGVVTFSLTVLGMKIGERVGTRFSHRMEILGGLILVGIGAKILVEHLYF